MNSFPIVCFARANRVAGSFVCLTLDEGGRLAVTYAPASSPCDFPGSTPSGPKGSGAFIITFILMIVATFIFCFKIVRCA
jgi:hypothetical protein